MYEDTVLEKLVQGGELSHYRTRMKALMDLYVYCKHKKEIETWF